MVLIVRFFLQFLAKCTSTPLWCFPQHRGLNLNQNQNQNQPQTSAILISCYCCGLNRRRRWLIAFWQRNTSSGAAIESVYQYQLWTFLGNIYSTASRSYRCPDHFEIPIPYGPYRTCCRYYVGVFIYIYTTPQFQLSTPSWAQNLSI